MEIESTNPNDFHQSSRLLKPQEIATLLNISRSFAYRLLQTGAIPVIRLGKACRVRPQDLMRISNKISIMMLSGINFSTFGDHSCSRSTFPIFNAQYTKAMLEYWCISEP
jgi:excisionase family DNA binding protein